MRCATVLSLKGLAQTKRLPTRPSTLSRRQYVVLDMTIAGQAWSRPSVHEEFPIPGPSRRVHSPWRVLFSPVKLRAMLERVVVRLDHQWGYVELRNAVVWPDGGRRYY